MRSWYEPLWRRGYSIDFAHPESDLRGYPLVLVPQLYSVTDHGARRVTEAAEAGSTVAIGYFSGAVDARDRVRAGGYPAPWQDLLGLWIEEYRPLLPGQQVALRACDPDAAPAVCSGSAWTEHLHLTDAAPVYEYTDGDLSGSAAVTRRDVPGGGVAWYLSTGLDPEAMEAVLLRIAAESAARPILPAPPPPDIEVAVRQTDSERYLFLLNHGPESRSLDLPVAQARPWAHALTREPAPARVDVPAGDVVDPRRTPVRHTTGKPRKGHDLDMSTSTSTGSADIGPGVTRSVRKLADGRDIVYYDSAPGHERAAVDRRDLVGRADAHRAPARPAARRVGGRRRPSTGPHLPAAEQRVPAVPDARRPAHRGPRGRLRSRRVREPLPVLDPRSCPKT